ncbi:response regulator [Aerosakkonema sp. BLCC-F183]|uniref:response regulator n=1 Tax=Aerosakkonema sp. BLCC-F183 TaxID=3342834 RepID=UPI0035B8434E
MIESLDSYINNRFTANILVVDDDINNLRLLTEVLSRRGYEVRPIRDERMVPAAIQAKQPDLILLDVMMPYIDGYEICSQLKANQKTRHIPVIFLSALHEAIDKVKAFSIGGVDYITKPFQTEEVIARIENQLHICRLQKQIIEQNERLKEEIKERELMAEKLRSSQAEIRGFFEAMADIVLIVDPDGKTIKVAPTKPEKLYPPGSDIIGKTVELLCKESSVMFRSRIRESLHLQQIVNCEYSLSVGREQVWFSASIAPISENTAAWVARDITDRKKAEAALYTSEERLHLALEGSNLGLWDWNLKTGEIYRDRAWNEMLGYQDSEIANNLKGFESLLHPEDTVLMQKALDAYTQGKNSCYKVEFRMRSKLGEWKWILCRGKISERDSSGQPVRITGTHKDISQQKALEQELALREARLNAFFKCAPVGMNIIDSELRYVQINEHFAQINGIPAGEHIGKSIREILPQIAPTLEPLYQQVLATGEPILNLEITGEIPSQPGIMRHWVVSYFPIALNDSTPSNVGSVIVEITDRKRAELELQLAKERQELVLRASQDGFWDWDLVTGEIYFSPRFKEMLGYSDDEFPNDISVWANTIFEEDRIAALKLVEDYNCDRIPQFLATQRFHHKNGSTVYILSRAIHLKDANGIPIRMIGAHTDITNLKQAEEALQKAVLAADAANRAKSEFLASMSHELRTPLNAILGFSQIMSKDDSICGENQKNLAIINRAGEHLLALIDDILEVSKIEAGRTNFNESSFDFIQMLNSLEQMLQLKAASKGLQLIFECSPNIPQYVTTDQGKLRQVLLNLLGNAIKFTEVGSVKMRVYVSSIASEVTTENEPEKLTVNFEVIDTGPGIFPEEIHLLFEAFQQTETGRKSQQGTGLGLPISQKYVQLMGGKIRVNSTPGQGSVFAFDIQIGLADPKLVQTLKQYRKIIHLASEQPEYRILIVDDVAESRLLLNKILVSIGFSVRESENGKEAVQCYKEWQPHLILMDIRMPVMDGYEATRQIRAEEQKRLNYEKISGDSVPPFPRTIVLALTASVFEEQRKNILAVGCNDFIRKPFQTDDLLEKIGQYLGVEYEWESENKEAECSQKTSEKVPEAELPKLLSQMPQDWIIRLHDAASECSDDMVLELLEEIPAENIDLANAIRDLADNFLFTKIIKLAEECME